MSTSTPPLNSLVEKIRAAHPGAYDDMDDATLTNRVLAKYPQYSDLAAPKLQQPFQVESSGTDKFLGALAPQPIQRGTPSADLPGFEGSYASGDEGKGLAMTGAGVAAGAGLAAPGVISALAAAAAAHPLAARVVMRGLEGLGLGVGLRAGAKFVKLADLLGAGNGAGK